MLTYRAADCRHSTLKARKGRIIVTLRKAKEQHWAYLTKQEQERADERASKVPVCWMENHI